MWIRASSPFRDLLFPDGFVGFSNFFEGAPSIGNECTNVPSCLVAPIVRVPEAISNGPEVVFVVFPDVAESEPVCISRDFRMFGIGGSLTLHLLGVSAGGSFPRNGEKGEFDEQNSLASAYALILNIYCFFCFPPEGFPGGSSPLHLFSAEVFPPSLFQAEGFPQSFEGRLCQSLLCCQSEF